MKVSKARTYTTKAKIFTANLRDLDERKGYSKQISSEQMEYFLNHFHGNTKLNVTWDAKKKELKHLTVIWNDEIISL
jgi:hypothetical protein